MPIDRLGIDEKDFKNVIVLEDAPFGVEAGLAAGMKVCWVPDARMDTSSYSNNSNVIIINSMQELLENKFLSF